MSGDKLKSMMNSSGSKPKKRVKLLPSIREESSLGSPRIPVHIIPPGTSRNLPFKRSMIIQTLPDNPRPRSPSPKVHYLDNVDQVVSEYLPYSRFNGVLPVVQGFAPLPCSCCVDRNRDNFRLKWERNHPPPPEPRNELDVDPNPDPGPSNLNSDSNNSSRPDQTPRNAANQSPRLGSIPQHSPRRGEMPENRFKFQPAYRPTEYRRPFPYPLYYLTSDWRRPHWLLAGDQDDHKQLEKTNTAYVMERVLDANIKYDLAMQKLERSLRTSFNDDD